MKPNTITTLAIFASVFVSAAFLYRHRQPAGPPFHSSGLAYDAGAVKKKTPVDHTVRFTNTGQKTLVLESAIVGCECTSVDVRDARILPGAFQDIHIKVDTSDMDAGPQMRIVNFQLRSGKQAWDKTASINMTIE